jgi:hypothetical protein
MKSSSLFPAPAIAGALPFRAARGSALAAVLRRAPAGSDAGALR